MMITNQITMKVQLVGEDMDLRNFVFQKCDPRGGYREQTWRNLNIGASIWCASRLRCQESTYFGAIFIKIRYLWTFGAEIFQVYL